MKKVNEVEWKKIQQELTSKLGICDCQRKVMSIIKALVGIREKILTRNLRFSANETLIVAFLDAKGILTHGTNIEYPILDEKHEFWQWLESVKNNPNLEDN